MKREDIKSYKDACKCIGRKPRKYKDDHMNTYEQLTTIIAALNFIAMVINRGNMNYTKVLSTGIYGVAILVWVCPS